MFKSRYFNCIKQSNGVRIYENPLKDVQYEVPENAIEIFVKEIPREFNEDDILPHFERFGPIYQFRLLIDYDNNNRGFAYLVYFYEKSALECLDLMSYFFIKPGSMLEVERSQERSHLLAINVPLTIADDQVKETFFNVFTTMTRCYVCRKAKSLDKEGTQESGTVILKFEDHAAALKAKRYGGQGSLALWGRNVKILWANPEEVRNLLKAEDGVQHIHLSAVPDDVDPDYVGELLCEHVPPQDIIQIRRVQQDWFIEVTNSRASRIVFEFFHARGGIVEFVGQEYLRNMERFLDFDFELRCMCLANYWEPPVFIYGRVIPCTRTQFCAVIIKNNRRNIYCTFILELVCHDLVELHSRVCEAVLLMIKDFRDLPKRNVVIKCTENCAFIVGAINNLECPMLTPSFLACRESIYLYLAEIFALSKMCFRLIAFPDIDEIQQEYKMILAEKNIRHQTICGIESEGNLLGCINPMYREGKALKFKLNSRQMIFAMCDGRSRSNVQVPRVPEIKNVKHFSGKSSFRFKTERFEFIPMSFDQRCLALATFRPSIEFTCVDTFSPLFRQLSLQSLQAQIQQGFPSQFNSPVNDVAFRLSELLKSLPK